MRLQLKTVIQIGFSIIAVIFLASFISNVTGQTKKETIEINDNNYFIHCFYKINNIHSLGTIYDVFG